ncbi:MAG: DNA topoisomerase I [Cellvibrio sp. 79]|nr:MAG: DNA topoisomerase I [Cellvibrio sp. 79]
MPNLLIVESPAKAKKMRGYFPDFIIEATLGHFKDLPKDSMGVEPPNHKPQWETIADKRKIATQLNNTAKKATTIYVATDLDREGEAIAGHVVNLLGTAHKSKISRITFDEISKKALQAAIANKRQVDWALVRAQEARRVLDRYVGYLITRELNAKFKSLGINYFFTGGRVQSVVLRLIVERDHAIKTFVPVEHYGVTASLRHADIAFTATWVNGLPSGQLMTDRSRAETVKNRTRHLIVDSVTHKPKQISPPAPLTSSAFVQLMATKLKLTTKQSMAAAQTLFEAGLITYHRTDSPHISKDFIDEIRSFAKSKHLPLPAHPPIHKAKDSAQQAHECIRVTDIKLLSPGSEITDARLREVYAWIWKVTLESQLVAGEDTLTTVQFHNAAMDFFKTNSTRVKSTGWRNAAEKCIAIKSLSTSDDEDEEPTTALPDLKVGATIPCVSVKLDIKHTEPPLVYTEKTLVKELDRLAIGRPSTYATVIERIVTLNYVTRHASLKFEPTTKGMAVVYLLKNYFSFMEYQYTADIEESFDKIATRKADYLTIISHAYDALLQEIQKFRAAEIPQEVKTLISQFEGDKTPTPKASAKKIPAKKETTTSGKSDSKSTTSHTPAKIGDKCPDCQKGTLVLRNITSGKNAGKQFKGCTGFPDCRFFAWPQVSSHA